jgi:hypothetical protein
MPRPTGTASVCKGVFEQGLDFRRFEEFLESVAAGEHAIAEGWTSS